MTSAQITIQEKLCQFINEYEDDRYCLLELLRFWGRHPCTRFSQLVIIHALDSRRPYVERALRYLINMGVVRTHIDNNLPVYSLTEEESLRSPVLNVAKLDWGQWQLVLGRI